MEQEQRLAYLAGFFDGEGCVTVNSNGSIQIRVINTNKEVLEMFVKAFGGSVLPRKQIVNKKQYHWSVYGAHAVNVAQHLEMFCVEKQDQLQRIIQWQADRSAYITHTKTGRGRFTHPDRSDAIKNVQKELTNMKMGVYAN